MEPNPSAVVYDTGAFASSLPIEALEPSKNFCRFCMAGGFVASGNFLPCQKWKASSALALRRKPCDARSPDATSACFAWSARCSEYAEAFDFDCEIETVEPLLFLLRRFLDGLCERLRAVYRVAQNLVLCLPLEDGSSHERTFCIPAPTAEVEVLFRILHTHLEDLQPRKAAHWCTSAASRRLASREGSTPALRKGALGIPIDLAKRSQN